MTLTKFQNIDFDFLKKEINDDNFYENYILNYLTENGIECYKIKSFHFVYNYTHLRTQNDLLGFRDEGVFLFNFQKDCEKILNIIKIQQNKNLIYFLYKYRIDKLYYDKLPSVFIYNRAKSDEMRSTDSLICYP